MGALWLAQPDRVFALTRVVEAGVSVDEVLVNQIVTLATWCECSFLGRHIGGVKRAHVLPGVTRTVVLIATLCDYSLVRHVCCLTRGMRGVTQGLRRAWKARACVYVATAHTLSSVVAEQISICDALGSWRACDATRPCHCHTPRVGGLSATVLSARADV